MAHDPALPNLTPEEQDELARRRQRYDELIRPTAPEEAQRVRGELQRVHARIKELIEKGKPREARAKGR